MTLCTTAASLHAAERAAIQWCMFILHTKCISALPLVGESDSCTFVSADNYNVAAGLCLRPVSTGQIRALWL